MHAELALYALAYIGRQVRIVCQRCATTYFEPSDYLANRFGPLFPVAGICKGVRCRKCGSRDLAASAA